MAENRIQVKKKTPEQEQAERQQRVDAGNAYIQQREQRAARLSESGQQSVKASRAQASKELSAQENMKQAAGISDQQITIEEANLARQEAAANLGQKGAFETNVPQETDLSPTPNSDIPVIGKSLGTFSQLPVGEKSLIQFYRNNGELLKKNMGKKGVGEPRTGEEAFNIEDYDTASLRELALRDISIESYNRGITKSEAFGSIVESIPVVGSSASRWARGLIETPSGNAGNVLEEISSERERAATSSEKVRSGLISPDYALSEAQAMEENIAELKGRIKLLINTSPILRANSDEVNKMQQQILRTEERIAQYKLAAQQALVMEQTGNKPIPTDLQIYYELQGIYE